MTDMSAAEYWLMPVCFLIGVWFRPTFDRHILPLIKDLAREF